jgi:hypothetical protein
MGMEGSWRVEGLIRGSFLLGDAINLPSTSSIPSTPSTLSKERVIKNKRRSEETEGKGA